MCEKLFSQLEKTTERFEVKLMMIDLTSRLIGIHQVKNNSPAEIFFLHHFEKLQVISTQIVKWHVDIKLWEHKFTSGPLIKSFYMYISNIKIKVRNFISWINYAIINSWHILGMYSIAEVSKTLSSIIVAFPFEFLPICTALLAATSKRYNKNYTT